MNIEITPDRARVLRDWLHTALKDLDKTPDAHNPDPNERTNSFLAVCKQRLDASHPLTLCVAIKLGELAFSLRGQRTNKREIVTKLFSAGGHA